MARGADKRLIRLTMDDKTRLRYQWICAGCGPADSLMVHVDVATHATGPIPDALRRYLAAYLID